MNVEAILDCRDISKDSLGDIVNVLDSGKGIPSWILDQEGDDTGFDPKGPGRAPERGEFDTDAEFADASGKYAEALDGFLRVWSGGCVADILRADSTAEADDGTIRVRWDGYGDFESLMTFCRIVLDHREDAGTILGDCDGKTFRINHGGYVMHGVFPEVDGSDLVCGDPDGIGESSPR